MKQLLLLALFDTVTIFLSAQIRLIDSATLEPVAAVNIYSDGGVTWYDEYVGIFLYRLTETRENFYIVFPAYRIP